MSCFLPHTAFYIEKYLITTNIVKVLSNCQQFSLINVSIHKSKSKSKFLKTFHPLNLISVLK